MSLVRLDNVIAVAGEHCEQVAAPLRAGVLDDDEAGPQRRRRVAEEGNEYRIFRALDIDLQRVDTGNTGVAQHVE